MSVTLEVVIIRCIVVLKIIRKPVVDIKFSGLNAPNISIRDKVFSLYHQFPGLNRPEHEADHSSPSKIEGKDMWC
jgi:hypothetical protein